MNMEKVIKELSELHGSSKTMTLISETIALLKEQEAVVRCKDCKHIGNMYKCPVFYSKEKQSDNWFCADGERAE